MPLFPEASLTPAHPPVNSLRPRTFFFPSQPWSRLWVWVWTVSPGRAEGGGQEADPGIGSRAGTCRRGARCFILRATLRARPYAHLTDGENEAQGSEETAGWGQSREPTLCGPGAGEAQP